MTDNKILGIKRVNIHGETYQIRFTWAEIAEIEANCGAAGPELGDLKGLATTAAIGMRAFHPEITAEKLIAMSPPVFVLQAAVSEALRFAYWGGKNPDDVVAEQTGAKKKFAPWRRFSRWLSGLVYRQANFGA